MIEGSLNKAFFLIGKVCLSEENRKLSSRCTFSVSSLKRCRSLCPTPLLYHNKAYFSTLIRHLHAQVDKRLLFFVLMRLLNSPRDFFLLPWSKQRRPSLEWSKRYQFKLLQIWVRTPLLTEDNI